MAVIKPFKGLRYNPEKVTLSKVIAPPYDVISPSEQEELYQRDPFNVVRLILGKQEGSDSDQQNRYTRARDFMADWLNQSVLVSDPEPAFYLYEQKYKNFVKGTQHTRRALFALLKVEEFSKGVVLPHEKTYAKAKADRLHLLNATHSNLSPVFGLYGDPDMEISRTLDPFYEGAPLFEATDKEDVVHRLWKLSDAAAAQKVAKSFETKKIVLADGHHRYETALNHWREKSQGNEKADGQCAYTMIALVDMHDPGLIVLPTHRLLKKIPDFNKDDFLTKLGEYFHITGADHSTLLEQIEKFSPKERGFGIYFKGREGYIAKLKGREVISKFVPREKSLEWANLEVSILSCAVIDGVLGLKEEQYEEHIAYTRSTAEALQRVDSGEFQMAFIVRSIPVDDIQKVCEKRDLMPHKSTYFYPKLASGLVFYQHEAKEAVKV